ncbi:MAG: hypothetical protein NC213_06580 [Acetobacter sp.]|nr:hypothetical protein [Bacteroides sp.]MCM1341391.1 hypothetical protein [Acetobacter sp.]MCM1433484.1 hypothetical protein [Clostridiales bacterium]
MAQETYYSGITYFLSIALLFFWGIHLLMKLVNRKRKNGTYDYWGDKGEFIISLGIIGLILFILYSSYKSFAVAFYSITQIVLIFCVLVSTLTYFLFDYKINKKIDISVKKYKISKLFTIVSILLLLFISYIKCTY